MSSESKRAKQSKDLPAMIDEDRLSNLPSSVIVKIISLLPTKEAVATSALSSNWKKMWTFIPNLELSDKLKAPTPSAMSFERFVNQVLLQRDKSSCLQSFRLKCEGHYKGSVVNTWIASVLLCINIQELNLSIPIVDPVCFPSDLFLCKTLVVLKLVARGKATIPDSFNLPVLKTLHLYEVELPDDVSVDRLLSGCPVMEELRLSRCIGKNVGVINIIAPALTSLTIKFLPYDDNAPTCDHKYQVFIDTPFLKYLYLSDFNPQGFVIKNLNHLIEAEIDPGYISDEKFVDYPESVAGIFNVISQVQSLVLSHTFMEEIWDSPEYLLPTFSNLTYLELRNVNDSWKLMLRLLENLPHLETLHIQECGGLYYLRPPNYVASPSCLLTHLKIIEVSFSWGIHEFGVEMMEYFLKNGNVLEKVTIEYYTDTDCEEENAKFIRQLQMCPRSSSFCQVEVLPSKYFSEFEL